MNLYPRRRVNGRKWLLIREKKGGDEPHRLPSRLHPTVGSSPGIFYLRNIPGQAPGKPGGLKKIRQK